MDNIECPELDGAVDFIKYEAIIGFDGNTVRALRFHPNLIHLIYPLGNKVCVHNRTIRKNEYLSGHTNTVSTIDVSRSGKYIASGQINHIGFKTRVILWDFATRKIISQHDLHKVRVEAVSFSRKDEFLLSLGGRDDGTVVVWDLAQSKSICGTAASRGQQGEAYVLCTMNKRDLCFVTAGDGNMTVWKIDAKARTVTGVDVNLSKLKRKIVCMEINERDEIAYCGTLTGDILKVRLNFHHDIEILDPVKRPMMIGCYTKMSKKKLEKGIVELYANGVRSLQLLLTGEIVIGGGDGTLDLVEEVKVDAPVPINIAYKLISTPDLRVIRTVNLKSAVTSLQFLDANTLLAGTTLCEIFYIDFATFQTRLHLTCHTTTIYDVAFPVKFSEVFATASVHDVRVWSIKIYKELLRLKVPNFACSKVIFSYDGKSILTSWNDGVIRAFTPLTGRLIYAIGNAHNKGVSALATTSHGKLIISGGCEGQVRLWDIRPTIQSLLCTLKEHKGPVSAIQINKDDDEAVSASTDGTCIIWDVLRQVRKQIIFSNTLFQTVRYYPTGVQILTGGSDRRMSYWEVLDGSLIREVEASKSGAINALDISPNGKLIVTGGNDQIVKLWKYQEGICTHIGFGHSAVVSSVCFSPNGRYMVTTSGAGGIFIWIVPEELLDEAPQEFSGDSDKVKEDKDEHIGDLESVRIDKDKKQCRPCKPCNPCLPCQPVKPCKPCKQSTIKSPSGVKQEGNASKPVKKAQSYTACEKK